MKVGRHEVNISNPDKLFFPARGLTKADLVRYYLDLAPYALNHIRRRPFHMKRFPNGVDGDFFHQKRVPPHPGFVGEQFVRFPSGHTTVFAVVDNAAALAWEEVPRADPAAFTLETMRDRVAAVGDPTAGIWRRRTSLRPRFEAVGLPTPA